MGLVLTTEAMRVVETNDRGRVTFRKRYKKGDVVDESKIDSDRLDALKAKGTLVDEAEFEDDTDEAPEEQEPEGEPEGSGDHAGGSGAGTPPAQPDQYDQASYPAL